MGCGILWSWQASNEAAINTLKLLEPYFRLKQKQMKTKLDEWYAHRKERGLNETVAA